MTDRITVVRDGVTLSCLRFGGDGPPVVLLHGLAGYGGEWAQTATWLTRTHGVYALDARGHGFSEGHPEDLSPAAQVADVVHVIESLKLGPVILVGQSMGGVTALLVAAQYPQLVRGLILVEAGPSDGGNGAEAADSIAKALGSWPVPFASRTSAEAFFTERWASEAAGKAWAGGLEQRDDGWAPRYELAVIVELLRGMAELPTWDSWHAVRCPTLIVRGGHGTLERGHALTMLEQLSVARLVEVPGAGHDLHLDSPGAWRATLSEFVDALQ